MKDAYDARDRDGVRRLAFDLMNLPRAARPAVAARLMAERIMLPTQQWVRFGVWLAKKRHGFDDYDAWAHIMSRMPRVADELFEQAAEWIVNGKDAGGFGIGGLDQREVNAVATMIGQALLYRWGATA